MGTLIPYQLGAGRPRFFAKKEKEKNMKVKLTVVSVLLTLALLSSLATAQVYYPAPPRDLDVTKASQADLDRYGIPPRPDPSQKAYGAWLHLVTSPQSRLLDGGAVTTNIVNGAARGVKVSPGTSKGNQTAVTSANWSGVAITANGNFTTNDSYVYTQFVMPKMGVDSCTIGGKYYASWWVGFDGFNNGDVLQAGAGYTSCTATNVLWYEWFESGCTSSSKTLPCYQTNFSKIPVSSGDFIGVEVWYTTAAPNGHAYVENYTTGVSVSVAFNQPSGDATYEGTSVEWIAERPGVDGGLSDLANYVGQGSDVDEASDGTNTYFPSSAPSGDTIYDITMTCPPWNPSSDCTSTTGLSWPYVPGGWSMWTFTEGPAYQ
jgi:hypothetical protein